MLTGFLYGNKVEVVRGGCTAKQLSQAGTEGCCHITDVMELCTLLSIRFITELQYHDLATSLFTVGKKNIQENLQKLHFKIQNIFT